MQIRLTNTGTHVILLAEDDPEDRFLTSRALEKNNSKHKLCTVENGEQLLDYLSGKKQYSDRARFPLPNLILLDLNMPGIDGREALRAIRANSTYSSIPVVMLTTSESREDIAYCYELGANSYICKPADFKDLKSNLAALTHYWFETVQLPGTKLP